MVTEEESGVTENRPYQGALTSYGQEPAQYKVPFKYERAIMLAGAAVGVIGTTALSKYFMSMGLDAPSLNEEIGLWVFSAAISLLPGYMIGVLGTQQAISGYETRVNRRNSQKELSSVESRPQSTIDTTVSSE